ncbi:pilus assembly protein TadG-related protein [Spongiactinospora sp. TRM90649]|uniref:pilus assembly protein TadG-related protein n=1 Tax=Spongiactinospora sp. TRM90649 TaxID=3031114 RepID=UPI0023F6B9E7|nr:pilus assembly protein TadG-related protein [Spongiactinospora sp. TRM90649]MDF5758420.1 TadG family pilus assembly protein [Spongiactinospora sp. TRM90649]
MNAERGSVTAFAAVISLALLVCAGLVVDGGAKIQAYRHAYAIAEEAARAGAGRVDTSRAYMGGRIETRPSHALTAARAYLTSAGRIGEVVAVGGRAVQVTVTASRPTRLLSLIGIDQVTATATATAQLFHGIEQGRP